MFTPQSALYGMRGMYGDGAPYRNRSAEQLRGYTGGNPNLPNNQPNMPAMPQFTNDTYGQLLQRAGGMQQHPGMPMMPGSMPGAATATMQTMPQMPTPAGGPQAPGYGNMGAQGPMPSKPMFVRSGAQSRAVMPIMGPRNAY